MPVINHKYSKGIQYGGIFQNKVNTPGVGSIDLIDSKHALCFATDLNIKENVNLM